MKLAKTRLLRYAYMRLAREFDARFERMLKTGRITKWYSAIGNEAVTVPAGLALEPGDVLCSLHRDVGAILANYLDPARAFPDFGFGAPDGRRPDPEHLLYRLACQVLGRDEGFSRGVERSYHYGYFAPEAGLFHVGMISHLGAMIPVAAGCAFALKQRGLDRVAINFIGEGGTSTGDFHEGLNLAAVWKLPLVLVVENNRYAFSTPARAQYACLQLSDRGPGYGIVAETVDGTDPDQVAHALEGAIARARTGKGPTLVEAMIGRLRGRMRCLPVAGALRRGGLLCAGLPQGQAAPAVAPAVVVVEGARPCRLLQARAPLRLRLGSRFCPGAVVAERVGRPCRGCGAGGARNVLRRRRGGPRWRVPGQGLGELAAGVGGREGGRHPSQERVSRIRVRAVVRERAAPGADAGGQQRGFVRAEREQEAGRSAGGEQRVPPARERDRRLLAAGEREGDPAQAGAYAFFRPVARHREGPAPCARGATAEQLRRERKVGLQGVGEAHGRRPGEPGVIALRSRHRGRRATGRLQPERHLLRRGLRAECRQAQPPHQQQLAAVAGEAGGAQRILDEQARTPGPRGVGRADAEVADTALGDHGASPGGSLPWCRQARPGWTSR